MVRKSATMLLEARRAASLTQAELAGRSGVPRSAISLYETGAREPGTDVFLRMLAATGATVTISRFSDEQIRRGRIFSDLLAFADELPHRWPGDHLEFPSRLWTR
jgi:transcriptional regulator with XRE-family HTH domain